VSWFSNEVGSTTRHVLSVTVGAPSLLKVLRIEPPLAVATQLYLDLLWRPAGGPWIDEHFDMDQRAYGRQPFRGPYAFFPQAGQYEVIAVHNADGLNPTVQLIGEVIQGVTQQDTEQILSSESSHLVETRTIILAAGVAQAISTTYGSSFMLFRKLLIENATANLTILNFGLQLDGHARFTIPGNTSREFSPEYLGRHTLTAVSAAGATLNTALSLW
jgi:hypothetical protein